MHPEQLGKYKIIEEIGIGGMGTVYRAMDTTIDMEVAIKILHDHLRTDEKAVNRFFNDAKSLGKLKHPNIVQIYATEMNEHYFVMEFLKGKSLKQIIASEGALNLKRALDITLPIADALKYIHESGLIHRDIKPHNVIVNPDGRAKLLDFGIACDKATDISTAGSVLGTVEYMSPEQLAGEKTLDVRTDIYSLGILLYEMLTGKVPFEAKSGDASIWQVVEQISNTVPKRVIEINPKVIPFIDEVVMRCLDKDKNQRRSSMSELIVELDMAKKFVGSISSSSYSTLATPGLPPPWWKRSWAWAGICALFLVIAAGIYWGGTKDDAGPAENAAKPKTPVKRAAPPPAVDVADDQKVNINTAMLDDLQRLPGVGPKTAERIMEYRKEVGGKFNSPNDLMGIGGIGVKKLEKMMPYITVE